MPKKGEGAVQKKIAALIQKSGEKGTTTAKIAARLKVNRQYVRKVIRTQLAGRVVTSGVASPQGGVTIRWLK